MIAQTATKQKRRKEPSPQPSPVRTGEGAEKPSPALAGEGAERSEAGEGMALQLVEDVAPFGLGLGLELGAGFRDWREFVLPVVGSAGIDQRARVEHLAD